MDHSSDQPFLADGLWREPQRFTVSFQHGQQNQQSQAWKHAGRERQLSVSVQKPNRNRTKQQTQSK